MKNCSNKNCKQINPQSFNNFYKRGEKNCKHIYRSRCKVCYDNKSKEEKVNYDKKYYIKNKIKILKRVKEYGKFYYINNKNKISDYGKIWRLNNKDSRLLSKSKRRTAKMNRMPNWLSKEQIDEIKWFYKMSSFFTQITGEQYDVDHIIPLQGKDISGLHVPWNLQILHHSENCSKSNKLLDEYKRNK